MYKHLYAYHFQKSSLWPLANIFTAFRYALIGLRDFFVALWVQFCQIFSEINLNKAI